MAAIPLRMARGLSVDEWFARFSRLPGMPLPTPTLLPTLEAQAEIDAVQVPGLGSAADEHVLPTGGLTGLAGARVVDLDEEEPAPVPLWSRWDYEEDGGEEEDADLARQGVPIRVVPPQFFAPIPSLRGGFVLLSERRRWLQIEGGSLFCDH